MRRSTDVTTQSARSLGASGEILFERIVGAHIPERSGAPALQVDDRTVSYGDLQRSVSSATLVMQRSGVGDGDRVMLVLENSPEFIVLFLAITSLGAIAVPVDPKAGAERFRFIAHETSPMFIVTGQADELPANTGVPVSTVTPLTGDAAFGMHPVPRARRPARAASVGAHTDAAIFFTGGATGRPKGVVLKHGQFLAIAHSLSSTVGMDEQHRELIISPMTHSGGWQRVTSTLLAGGCVVIAESFVSPSLLFDDIRKQEINGFFITPPWLRTIIKMPAEGLRPAPESLRTLEIGSAPVTAQELEQLMNRLPQVDVWLHYGLTECSRAIMLDARKHADKLHTIGCATAGVEVAILSEDGESLGAGENGEVALRGPQRTDRYWSLPDLNLTRFRDGWLLTGDYGHIDASGFVVLRGRRDDMINCGGFCYFPAEVEVALGPLEGVRVYLVAGVPDPQGLLGDVPWLFAVPLGPQRCKPEQAMKRARERLPRHMVPRNIVIVSELPISASGKANRRLTVRRHGPQRNRPT